MKESKANEVDIETRNRRYSDLEPTFVGKRLINMKLVLSGILFLSFIILFSSICYYATSISSTLPPEEEEFEEDEMSIEKKKESNFYHSLWENWKVCQNPSPEGTCLPQEFTPHVNWQGNENIERVIVIGDVHGCLEELKMLLSETSFNPEKDSVVFLGDLVNKGPDSVGVLEYVQSINAQSVRGNHDDKVLFATIKRRILLEKLNKKDITNKERDDIMSKLKGTKKFIWTDKLTKGQITWLNELPLTISLPEKFSPHNNTKTVLLVHAGLVPDVPVHEQKIEDMLCMRDVEQKDQSWKALERKGKNSKAWANVWKGPHHIYFGHDAGRRLQTKEFATGIDTGCVFGDRLTAVLLPEGRLVSVNSRNAYI